MKKMHYWAIGLLTLIAGMNTSCSDEIEGEIPSEKAELKITADMGGYDKEDSKAIFTGTSFADGAHIGVYVLNSSGSAYDGQACTNLDYSVSSSKWSCAKTTYLSATAGTVYAYYPYNSGWDIGAIAVTATTSPGGGTDYMYATPKSVSQASTTAALTMNHALVAVKVSIKRGTYTGTGKVTALTWKCAGAGTGGTLNAKTGAISSPTGGSTDFNTGLTADNTYTITTTAKDYVFMAVPTGTAGGVTFNVTMDGKTFSVTSSSVTLAKGKQYQYVLQMDSKTMSLKATLTDWAAQTQENLKPSF